MSVCGSAFVVACMYVNAYMGLLVGSCMGAFVGVCMCVYR